jgi:hypothetical protein
VQNHHELGKGWSPKDGVVGALKIHDDKADELNTKVVGCAELDWEGDLSQGLGGLP